jgi:DNA primase
VQITADDEAEAMEVDPSPPEQQTTVEWRPKRFRRVFLDHQQWLSRDPALVREWQRAEAHKKSMTALYGHPFESYRPQVCV